MLTFGRGGPLDLATFHERETAETTPDRRLRRNRSNRYLTREHLGSTDRAITAAHQMLL